MSRKFLYTIFVLLALTLPEFSQYFPFLRYGKYITFLIFLILFFESQGRLEKYAFTKNSILLPFLILVIFNFFHLWKLNNYLIIESIILIGAILPFITVKKLQIDIKAINFFLFITFFARNQFNISIDASSEAFLTSQTATAESNVLPFLFGFLSLFFLVKKQYLWFIFNFIFVILSFKRIVFISLISIIFFRLLKLEKFKRVIFLAIIANSIWLFFSYFITTDSFKNLSFDLFNMSPGFLTQGRSTFYEIIFSAFKENTLFNAIFGIGGGETRRIIENSFYGKAQLLHNDILKIFVEYGLIVFYIFIYLLYKNKKGILFLTMYLNVLFLTDNTLIYEPVLFLFFILTHSILNPKYQNKIK